MEKELEYTITVFTEDKTGLLLRVVSAITRRHININSITASESSIEGIHRYTIVVILCEDRIRKLVAQIDKQVDVLKAFYYSNEEIVYQEIALYKISSKAISNGQGHNLEKIIRKHHARILFVDPEYSVIEKTGHKEETEALLEDLREIGIFEFVRSGRVAIVKPMERLNQYLKNIESTFSSKKI